MSFKEKNQKQQGAERAKGFDLCQIIQTGHVVSVSGEELKSGGAIVTIGVRSSVGNRYDVDYDDNNEVTIFWNRYYKNVDAAENFVENCKKGKYVTVVGHRQDYNKREKGGTWEHLYENYIVETLQWGVDFNSRD